MTKSTYLVPNDETTRNLELRVCGIHSSVVCKCLFPLETTPNSLPSTFLATPRVDIVAQISRLKRRRGGQ